MDGNPSPQETLRQTPLAALHKELGGKMTEFAGWSLPVMYTSGIVAEHLHVRAQAGLFDVSHMGQIEVSGERAAAALSAVLPVDFSTFQPGRMRYTVLLNDAGGVIDDLMITHCGDSFFLVVNAAHGDDVIACLAALLPSGVKADLRRHRAMLALQGPQAEDALVKLVPRARGLAFMDSAVFEWNGAPLRISRSGYTGEDGFEIALDADRAESLARALLDDAGVLPIGLGARDTLRLEAGLPLAGQDVGPEISPLEAGIGFAIAKSRLSAGGFPGADAMRSALATGPARQRVGLLSEGRHVVRQGAAVLHEGKKAGEVTSGGFAPTLNRPIAMALLDPALAAPGQKVLARVRDRDVPLAVTPLPFVPHRYRPQKTPANKAGNV